MKKLYLFIVLLLPIGLMAEEIEILTKDGKKHNGNLMGRTDSTITISYNDSIIPTTFNANEIMEAITSHGLIFKAEKGKIIGYSYEEIMAYKYEEESKNMGNPNCAIGHAMKVAGGVSLGIGATTLVIGAVLIASAESGLYRSNKELVYAVTKHIKDPEETSYIEKMQRENKNREKHNNCKIAGLVLMPFGGALTVVGVPLVVHGQRIVDLSVQISENGPGVAVKF